MTKEQQMVREFNKAFQQSVADKPCTPSAQDQILRRKLIYEEWMEFVEAKSLTGIADALGDLLYVVYGAAVTYGIDLEPVFNEIHRSNMTKLWPGGKVVKNDDGKVIKPPTYSPANVEEEVRKQLGQ